MRRAHRPRKRFAQNFLVDRDMQRQIVGAMAPQPADQIVEIGPGRGALTGLLLQATTNLTAIEVDRDLAQGLQRRYRKLKVMSANALTVNYHELLDDSGATRIIGNLPYNISTPLLFRILEHAEFIRDAHFLLQEEVVQRMSASPGTRIWGRLGVMVQYYCQVQPLFEVPPDAFHPRPTVRSRLVRLKPHSPGYMLPADSVHWLREVVRVLFAARRKTLGNALKGMPINNPHEILESCALDATRRAETLGLKDFINMANILARGQYSGDGAGSARENSK